MRLIPSLSLIIAASYSLNISATTDPSSWLWLDSSLDPNVSTTQNHQDHFTRMGTPVRLTNINDQLDEFLLDGFYALVPEGQPVDPTLLENTFNNIGVKDDFEGTATVKVAFLNEGAGYKNALGYFIYESNNPPTSSTIADVEHVLIFPNSSKAGSGGELVQGDQVDLKITLPAGHSIGFFIASNNWDGWYGGQKTNFQFGQPFYSLPALNPTVGLGNKYHVLFRDTLSGSDDITDIGFFAYGFEDIRTDMGDKDFNDLIFNVEVTPLAAIAGLENVIHVKSVRETEYKKAGKVAFEDNWPMQGDYDFNDAVIAYDANKIISTKEIERNNQVTQVEVLKSLTIDYGIEAIGATYRNGLALSLPNIKLENIASLTLQKTDAAGRNVAQYQYANGEFKRNDVAINGFSNYPYPLALETQSDRLVVTLSENLFEELSHYQAGNLFDSVRCMYRTSRDNGVSCPSGTTTNTWQLSIEFKHSDEQREVWLNSTDALNETNYDHFMFASEKGNPAHDISHFRFERYQESYPWFNQWLAGNPTYSDLNGPGRCLEIHLSEFSGTDFFEAEGSYRDGQLFTVPLSYEVDASLDRPFNVTDKALPWVLDLPSHWRHPLESQDIAKAYPEFINWLNSPEQYADWYKQNINSQFIFNAE